MCTAISLNTGKHYFGRNLDLAYHYDERVVIAPRNYVFPFRQLPALSSHYAIIGMATITGGYPLYYDATNEAGLSMAGLNFPDNAVYPPIADGKDNVSPFEFIPWVLAQCETVAQARMLLSRVNLAAIPFSKEIPLSPLHWMIADRESAITVESMADGLHVHDNPIGVLTNNPPFDYHMTNLRNYMALSPSRPRNAFAPGLSLSPYGLGMGAIGLPGDCSPASRFVRAAFTKAHSVCSQRRKVSSSCLSLLGKQNCFGFTLGTGNTGISLSLCLKDHCLLVTLSAGDGRRLMSLCLKQSLSAVALSLHLLFHGVLDLCGRNDILKLNAAYLDAPLIRGLVKDSCHLAVYGITGGESSVKLKLTYKVTKSCRREIFKGGDGVDRSVCVKLCVIDTEIHHGIYLHRYVILCDNGLGRRVKHLLLESYLL